MKVMGCGTIMIKFRLTLIGISAGKYSQQDKCLLGWHNFNITGQRFLLVLPCFYNRVLRGIKFFVRSRKFKPTRTQECEKSYPPRRPSQPAPVTHFSVAYQIGTCQKTTKNLLRLKTMQLSNKQQNQQAAKSSLTSSKIKLLILFIGNQNFSHIWSSAVNRFEVIKTLFSRVVTSCALSYVLSI